MSSVSKGGWGPTEQSQEFQEAHRSLHNSANDLRLSPEASGQHRWQRGKGNSTALKKHVIQTKETMVTMSPVAARQRVSWAEVGETTNMAK